MYYNKRKLFISIMWIIVGAALLILDIVGIVDNPICSGIGGGWLAIGIMQIYKNLKYHSNEDYKEKVDIAFTDERNRYLRMKAWSLAGYIFVIGAAVVSLVLFVLGLKTYSQILSSCMCVVLVLYWFSYRVLQKRD